MDTLIVPGFKVTTVDTNNLGSYSKFAFAINSADDAKVFAGFSTIECMKDPSNNTDILLKIESVFYNKQSNQIKKDANQTPLAFSIKELLSYEFIANETLAHIVRTAINEHRIYGREVAQSNLTKKILDSFTQIKGQFESYLNVGEQELKSEDVFNFHVQHCGKAALICLLFKQATKIDIDCFYYDDDVLFNYVLRRSGLTQDLFFAESFDLDDLDDLSDIRLAG